MLYSVLAADDGQRANENPINPLAWTTVPGVSPLQILSNQIGSSVVGVSESLYTGCSWPENQWAEIKINNFAVSGPSCAVQLRLRTSLTEHTEYGLEVQGPLGPTSFLIFFNRVRGTVLNEWISYSASGLNIGAINAGDVIRLEAYKNRIMALVNGKVLAGPSQHGVVLDSSIAAGIPGVVISNSVSLTDVQVSHFLAGRSDDSTASFLTVAHINSLRGRH